MKIHCKEKKGRILILHSMIKAAAKWVSATKGKSGFDFYMYKIKEEQKSKQHKKGFRRFAIPEQKPKSV